MNDELLEEMRKEANNDKLLPLNKIAVKKLQGQRIQTIYFGYAGQDGVDDFIVGELISQYDIAAKQEYPDFESRAAYWESYMSEEKLKEKKEALSLITKDGRNTYINASENSDFMWCSDSDREVLYRIYEN